MRATARLVFDRKHTASLVHQAAVQIEIYFHGSRKWLPTGIKLTKDQWYNKRGILVTNRADANLLSHDLMQQLEAIERILIRAGENFQWSMLDQSCPTNSFIDFVRTKLKQRMDLAPSTKKQHLSALNMLIEFGQINYFSDWTEANAARYNDWLIAKGYEQATVWGHQKRIKPYIRMAINEGLIDKNPYQNIKIPKGAKNLRKYLTDQEMSQLQKVEILNPSLSHVRDLFVFQAYTGLSYSDMAKFRYESDVTEREGRQYLIDTRTKTGETYYLQLLPPAMAILEKYDYQLNVISNAKYNKYLKDVATIANLHKNLTTHMARHTFAVWVLNNNIPIESLSTMLGHTSIRTTQIYAHIVQKSLDQAFSHLSSTLTPPLTPLTPPSPPTPDN